MYLALVRMWKTFPHSPGMLIRGLRWTDINEIAEGRKGEPLDEYFDVDWTKNTSHDSIPGLSHSA